ncbi:hypothetical protein SLS59_005166 [Nothophoma quercina]|uniref:Peptidase A1 domain-containing protein n=1 Tax=Nothophoma quercina TaxID=749835 RepID=A0ABR3RC31_9PLEO
MGPSGFFLTFAFLAALRLSPTVFAAQYITVPWSTQHYGPDGPWQAVQITVGGTSPDILLINEDHKQLDLLPGGEWNSKILSSKACTSYKDGSCGKGGTWDPEAPPTVDVTEGWQDEAARVNSSGQGILLQATTVSSFSQWNTSLVIVEDITITNPDGSKRGPELGSLALGGPEQSQKFATDATRSTEPMLGFSFAGGAYNESKTSSFSYGLHIGSAFHNYPGSLTFGGYDKGRLIGPYTSFNGAPTLLDVTLGVVTGGSPWDFTNKTGLLLSNMSQPTTLEALPDPRQTYIHLPGKTCEAIAKYLPITFDTKLKYWLWDTTKPEYSTIVTSPSYLGFVFPPAPGASVNVTIKVPFSLLNLTLDKPITTKPTAYFPCQSYEPSSDDKPYILGRAFLQAAFLGRNWNRQISWLGQAPGPGVSKDGLGNVMLDIDNGDTDLKEVFTNNQLFTQGWSNYWTPLPEPSSTASATLSPTPPASSTTEKPDQGLSVAVKVGIALGASAVVLLAIGVYLLFMRHRRRQTMQNTHHAHVTTNHESPKTPELPSYSINELEPRYPEMQGGFTHWTYELPNQTPQLAMEDALIEMEDAMGNTQPAAKILDTWRSSMRAINNEALKLVVEAVEAPMGGSVD